MPTLELQDPQSQFTTVDFTGSTYPVMWGTLRGFGDNPNENVPFRAPENQFRVRSFDINIVGTSEANLISVHKNLLNNLTVCRDRYEEDRDNACLLVSQTGTTASNDAQYRVRNAWMSEPVTILSPVFASQFKVLYATVFLETEAIGEFPTQSTTNFSALENEVDSAGTNFNYQDLGSGTDRAERSLISVKLRDTNAGTTNAWSGAGTVWMWSRSNPGSTDKLNYQGSEGTTPVEITSPILGTSTHTAESTGGRSTNASAGDSAYAKWAYASGNINQKVGWTPVVYFPFTINSTALAEGTHRVLARLAWDNTSTSTTALPTTNGNQISFAIGYSFGNTTSVPNPGTSNTTGIGEYGDYTPLSVDRDTWETIDIGRLQIPPVATPNDLTAPSLEMRVYAQLFNSDTGNQWAGELRLNLDYLQLADADGNFTAVEGVESTNQISIISRGSNAGVYLTSTADVVQRVPTHHGSRQWSLQGSSGTFFYWLRSDPSDPSNIQSSGSVIEYPRTRGAF